MRTRNVDKHKYKNYLDKAEQYETAMDALFEQSKFDACMGNAIHCAISAADALCVFKKGLRHAGERHEDAISLFLSIDTNDKNLRLQGNRLSRLLNIKTSVEYGERLFSRKDANSATKSTKRFFEFVKQRIPRGE